MGAKTRAFIMILIAFAWPLICGLSRHDETRIVGVLFLVTLGLGGVFIYFEQIKKEVIAALKNQDSNG